jgi:hypothetical protein
MIVICQKWRVCAPWITNNCLFVLLFYQLSRVMYAPWITSVLALSHPLVRALINANRNHPKQPMNFSVKPWFLRTPSANAWLCLRDCGFYEYQQRINMPLPKSTCYYERVFVTCNRQLHGQHAYGSLVMHAWSQDKHTRGYYKPQSCINQKSTPARCRRNSPCFTYLRMRGSWKPRLFINHGNNKNITYPKAT